ncbi:hypothetical protein C8J57DRAFT_116320 [Mycena rebaudengoi]|nr:hypothetical protein C8J57DRAFT_116320 [Mycena rebaudengoi]
MTDATSICHHSPTALVRRSCSSCYRPASTLSYGHVYPSRAEPAAPSRPMQSHRHLIHADQAIVTRTRAPDPDRRPIWSRCSALTLGSCDMSLAGDATCISRFTTSESDQCACALASRVRSAHIRHPIVTQPVRWRLYLRLSTTTYSTSYFRGLRPIPMDRLGSSSHAQTGEQYRCLLRRTRVVLLSRGTPSRHWCPAENGPGDLVSRVKLVVDSGQPPLGRTFFRLVETSKPLLIRPPCTPAFPFPTERRAPASSRVGKLP